jgi:ABC-2 type transport system permease protein
VWAMIVKEFRQLRRDRRTLAMMVVLPVLLLVVFGYAASFDVTSIPARVVGPLAAQAADRLRPPFEVKAVAPDEGRADAVAALRDGTVPVAVVAEPDGLTVLLDGSELFTANAARASLARFGATVHVEVLFNPGLATSAVMVPGLAGMILLFIGTVITSLGVVRERQSGTLEQLAVMPLRPRDARLADLAVPGRLGAAVPALRR